ncbi:Retrovirus-related Pol polyprotein from transposon TNT 1-94 [Gossypium australe]|uniref:Retrovirus-related Pol polyprotein from transposon TNT 1-94 n=1 Tax=Gossypium australe TaxID=47621 RepID=A0A5B6WAC4_9ROSI|nr:Retrovirus-related Pol polyprotein from transposon TNT 1-94 [Gossypium australe]
MSSTDWQDCCLRHVVFNENQFLSTESASMSAKNSMGHGQSVSTFVPLLQNMSSRPSKPPSVQPYSSSPQPVDCLNTSTPVAAQSRVGSDREPQGSLPSDDGRIHSNNIRKFSSDHQTSLVPVINSHLTVTRSKAGIFRPKALTVEALEPTSIEEALFTSEWREAAQAKYDVLVRNSTWLFKIKKNPNCTIARRKARLVAKGCSQVPRCDFKETFNQGWSLREVDVNNAFLNRDLDTAVFMHQPLGYKPYDSDGKPFICNLKKALYGLRQVPRTWFEKLKQFLISVNLVVLKSDASLFVRVISGSTLYVLVYVDDIIITSNLPTSIDWFVQLLNSEFSLKDMGDLHYFLGIEVTRSFGCLHLCQKKYIHDVLDHCSIITIKSVHTPMVSSSSMSKNDGECLTDPTEYRILVGALQYVVLTRLDIAYVINWVCQSTHNPTTVHIVALKCILRYLCGTIEFGIIFRLSDRLSLVGYADANWGLDFDDRCSTSGYYVYFGQTPMAWCSKKQQVVSRSTAEVEYRSLAVATSEVTWLWLLLQELQIKSNDTLNIWCDSSSAMAVAANPVLHSKFKHVKIDLFFVRKKVTDGSLQVGEVLGYDQMVDIFTKPMSFTMFSRF